MKINMVCFSICMLLSLTLSGCQKLQTQSQDLQNIRLVDTIITYDNTDYVIPQLEGLHNQDVLKQANESLKNEFFIVDNEEVIFGFVMRTAPHVTMSELIFVSRDFICVRMISTFYGSHVDTTSSYCTINTTTGEWVGFSDIVYLSEEFTEFIEKGNYTYPKFQITDTATVFDEASVNNYNFLKNNCIQEYQLMQISNKGAFYLKDNEICVQLYQPNSGTDLRISVETIVEFLVDKNQDFENYLPEATNMRY